MSMDTPILDVRFFKTDSGTEPVRDWLHELAAIDRKTIGGDIKTVQFGWPHRKSTVYSSGKKNNLAAWIYKEISSYTQVGS